MGDLVTLRRIISAVVLAVTLGMVVQPAAEAAAPQPKRLSLSSYTVSIWPPDAPATVCDYNETHCGTIAIEATFSGLSRLPRPSGPEGGPEANLAGSVQVTRVYGCQNAAGQRLHRYDSKVTVTAWLNTRRGGGFTFPRTGDTATGRTFAFLSDLQPHNCPAGTTAMIYKIVATKVQLDLESHLSEYPSATYKVPTNVQWVGAVPTPTTPASN